jgi:Methyltransferase domain
MLRRRRVEGMISPDEERLLARLAAATTHGCIVEVGSYRGMSTIALARAATVPVFAIEPHEPFQGIMGGTFGPADRRAFMENVIRAAVAEKVRLVNLSSEVVTGGWHLPVGLLWIDGDHRYEAVRRDLECWQPHLVGPVAFHDSCGPTLGPTKLVAELVADGYEVSETVGATTVLERR